MRASADSVVPPRQHVAWLPDRFRQHQPPLWSGSHQSGSGCYLLLVSSDLLTPLWTEPRNKRAGIGAPAQLSTWSVLTIQWCAPRPTRTPARGGVSECNDSWAADVLACCRHSANVLQVVGSHAEPTSMRCMFGIPPGGWLPMPVRHAWQYVLALQYAQYQCVCVSYCTQQCCLAPEWHKGRWPHACGCSNPINLSVPRNTQCNPPTPCAACPVPDTERSWW
jgi:hypothetical protein